MKASSVKHITTMLVGGPCVLKVFLVVIQNFIYPCLTLLLEAFAEYSFMISNLVSPEYVSPSLLWETFPLKFSRLESDLFGLKIRFNKNTPNRIFGFNLLHNVLYLIMLFRFHATTTETIQKESQMQRLKWEDCY